jgi:regulator of cell morphogenesis and NO signaling
MTATPPLRFDKAPEAQKTSMVGQVVADKPLRARVMELHGIDYCCGGDITLEEACLKNGFDVQVILEELNEVDQGGPCGDTDWSKMPLQSLIDHIVSVYHRPLREELPRIGVLAQKVARAHGESHPEMRRLADIFMEFREELLLHMQKEELILFPGIVRLERGISGQVGCGMGIEHPIAVMMHEHESAGDALCAMRQLTDNYTPPPDACNSFKALLFALAQMDCQMREHVHKENNILFPRAQRLAPPTIHPKE